MAQDVVNEFECVYKLHDYHAAEILGDAVATSGIKLDQQDTYWLANASYIRGNSAGALRYARLAYARLTTKDKASCSTNVNRCRDLRRLFVAIAPSNRTRFASEDAAIKAAAQEAEAEAAEASREAAATAFEDSGSGIHSTETFHVSGEWRLDWSYDCSDFGDNGNFIVDVSGDVDDTLVNQLGSGDSGSEYVHEGGDVYLKINSECSWTVKAVNE